MRRGEDFRERARRHHFTPAHPRAGAEIQNIIGPPNRVLVMLHHEHGVAKSRKPSNVFSNRSLSRWCNPMLGKIIQNIKHADQARADLRGEPEMRCASPPLSKVPLSSRFIVR